MTIINITTRTNYPRIVVQGKLTSGGIEDRETSISKLFATKVDAEHEVDVCSVLQPLDSDNVTTVKLLSYHVARYSNLDPEDYEYVKTSVAKHNQSLPEENVYVLTYTNNGSNMKNIRNLINSCSFQSFSEAFIPILNFIRKMKTNNICHNDICLRNLVYSIDDISNELRFKLVDYDRVVLNCDHENLNDIINIGRVIRHVVQSFVSSGKLKTNTNKFSMVNDLVLYMISLEKSEIDIERICTEWIKICDEYTRESEL